MGNSNTSGGVPTDANNYEAGMAVTVAQAGTLARTGYAFAGWNTNANGSGTARAAGSSFAMGSSNVVLHAQWTVNVGITVGFQLPEDETITLGADQSVSKNSALSVSCAQSFDEYRWYIDGVQVAGLSGQSASIQMTPYSYGNHNLTIAVRNGTLWYSKILYFRVKA